jgi:hypothetical protein
MAKTARVKRRATFNPERRKKFFSVDPFEIFLKSLTNPSSKSNLQRNRKSGPWNPVFFGKGLKSLRNYARMLLKMDPVSTECREEKPQPACFGDEAKFVAYMETMAADAECARCPREDECGEFILLKCSRELIF